MGTAKYPDAGILLKYDDELYSQGNGQTQQALKVSTKDDIVQPFLSYHDFISSKIRVDDVDHNLYVFDKRYQQQFTASQPIQVELKFDGVVSKDINGYALVLTNKLVSVCSDGQRHFDLI